jgi:hypothetical protein
MRNLSLSKNSFPSLRRIAIRNLQREDIMLLWGLETLVQNLDQVEIALDIVAEQTLSDKQALGNRFFSDFIPMLSARSPGLTKIVIDFNSSYSFDRVDALPLDIARFEPLSSLPLRWVELRSICIKAPEGASRIAALWPNVVDLKLPSQSIASDELHHFAVLPLLRHLVLDVSWATQTWKRPRLINPDFAMLPLHTLEFSKRPEHELHTISIEDHARYVVSYRVSQLIVTDLLLSNLRYLLSFWPNLQNLIAPTYGHDTAHLVSFNALNSFIKLARGYAETKRRIASQYGANAVRSLIPQELAYFP